MVIIVTASGRVDQGVVEVGAVDDDALAELRAGIIGAVVGRTPSEAADALATVLETIRPEYRPIAAQIVATTLQVLAAEPAAQIVVAGVPNLAGKHFQENLRPLLEALEEQVVLMRLLGEAAGDDVTVRIGEENTADGFQSTSLVASGYGSGDASLGVVGPTRMDYPATIASVRAVARYVSRFLMEG